MYSDQGDELAEEKPLAALSDGELGRRVRETPAFRLAVACHHLADSLEELREADRELYARLLTETNSDVDRVQSRESIEEVVDAFIGALESYSRLVDEPDDVAEEALEAAADGGDEE